jgi:hypothetical protein
MAKIEYNTTLQESENKLINVYLSMINNIHSNGLICVDLSDLFGTTWKMDTIYLLLEKTSFNTLESFQQLIDKSKFHEDIKTIWVELRFGKKYFDDYLDIREGIADTLFALTADNVKFGWTDCSHLTPEENYISILGFG